jgi:light-independent protochlorophyllide reductase subunit N
MVTGCDLGEGRLRRYLFADAFFWEDVVSMLVLALHTAYLAALFTGWLSTRAQMLLALAAYATYVVNAAQFVLPVLRERGQREVFCGLTGIVWLHRKIQDAFFLVVGSRTCAHLIQSAAGVMIFAEPRFATAIIDERDLAGLADANDELDRVVTPARAPPRHQAAVPGRLLPVGGDQARPVARRAAAVARVHPRVRVLNYSGSGIETTFTQGEDACLAAGAGAAGHDRRRAAAAGRRRAGRRGRGPVRRAVRGARHRAVRLPAAAPRRRPAAGRPEHALLLAQPFLGETARARSRRGARALPRPSRSASRAPPPGCAPRPMPSASGASGSRPSPRRARARRALARASRHAAGKRIFFFPDSQLEIAARALPVARAAACELTEVGTPYLHRQHLAEELALLPAGHAAQRRPGRRRSSTAAAPRARPHGLRPRPRQSARGRGHDDQVVDRARVHADPGLRAGRDLAELFARPLDRRTRLEV